MSKKYISEEILEKQFFAMSGAEIIELFSYVFPTVSEPIRSSDLSDYVVGIKGLANFLQCGTTKAQEIKNSGVLDEATHYIGKKVYFNREKLLEIMSSKKFQNKC